MAGPKYHIFVCEHTRDASDPRGNCHDRGGVKIREAMKDEIHTRGLKSQARANAAGCLDACKFGPTVVVYPEGTWYTVPTEADAREIIAEHVGNGRVVTRLLNQKLHPTSKP